MSMATRCTSCGTIFRVVQDQLKVSEGWVRCGRCDEVFNALEGLFDLDRESPPPWTRPSTEQAQTASAQRREAYYFGSGEQDVAELDEDDRIASRFFRPEQDDVERSPAQAVAQRDRVDFADAQFPNELLGDASNGATAARSATRSKPARPAAKTKAAKPDKTATPAFLRRAEAQARWRKPWARAWLSLASIVLLGALALQVAHHFRDVVAAQWSQTKPLLLAWCTYADCQIEPPRRIDDIMVESTALNRAVPGTDSYRLLVTLRNRGNLVVAAPAIELSLTDGSGQLVARRALAPADFRPVISAIAPGGEAALQSLISTNGSHVAGFTVEVFYP